MTREEFRTRWNVRLNECVRLGIHFDGERFCREVLADFEAVITAEDDRLLGLADAAEASGYCADHLRRVPRNGGLSGGGRGGGVFFPSISFPSESKPEPRRSFAFSAPASDAP